MKLWAAPLAFLLVLFLSPAARSAPATSATIEILGVGELVNGGEAVDVLLAVSCHRRYVVLEANLSVSQDSVSGFTGINVPQCTNATTTFVARVPSNGGLFQVGEAFASAFLLVKRRGPSGETAQSQHTATISIQ